MRYNVVIIGAGNIASGYDDILSPRILTHAHALKTLAFFNFLGFYDIDERRAEAAAQKWGVEKIDSLENIQKEIDIICCAAPDEFHYEILKKVSVFSSLKAVICEKPITRKTYQAKELVKLYKEKNIPLFVNYTRRFLGEFTELKHWISRAGSLIVGNCYYGKGVFHNCSHMINILEYILADLELLSTDFMLYDFFEEDPSINFVLKNESSKIYFHPIDCNIATVFEFDLFFENGRVRYSDHEGSIDYYQIKKSSVYSGELNYLLDRRIKIKWDLALLNLYKNVYDAICNQSEVCSDGEEAYKTISLCEKITKKVTEKK